MGKIANHKSAVFSERGQLSQTIPQFNVNELTLHQRTPIAWFESQRNERKVHDDQILYLGGYDSQRNLMIRARGDNSR